MTTLKSNNPYNPSDEGNYLAWDHGANSKSDSDCPYEADDKDNRQYRDAWLKGFRTSPHFKAKKKSTVSVDQELDEQIKGLEVQINEEPLAAISTELLELELRKRKTKELDDLLITEQKIVLQLQQVQKQIKRLHILMGD